MKVLGLSGIDFVARGLRYISQLTILLKYLSSPAMMGPTPKPIRSAHQAKLSRASNRFIRASCAMEFRKGSWLQGCDFELNSLELLWHDRPRLCAGTQEQARAPLPLERAGLPARRYLCGFEVPK